MNRPFPHDLLSFSTDSLVMLDNPTFNPFIGRDHYPFGEEPLSKKTLVSPRDKIDTITDSDEESESLEGSPRNSSLNSSESLMNKGKMEHGRWTSNEHRLFLEGLIIYGNEWKMVQKHIGTRSSTQARSHAQKFFIKIRKQIMNERNKEVIHSIIHEVFKKEMNGLFNPINMQLFLERIATLVFASDNKSKQLMVPLKNIKSTSLESNSTLPLLHIGNKVTGPIVLSSSSPPSSLSSASGLVNPLHEYATKMKVKPLLIQKEKYFTIEKDKEKMALKTSNRVLNNHLESLTKSLNYFENSSMTTTLPTSPSEIYYATTIVMNSNSDSGGYDLKSFDKQKRGINNTHTTIKTNPFNLQFEEILNKSKPNLGKNTNHNNDEDNNQLIEEKLIIDNDNDDHSFSSFEL